jgi:hypothetical protein
MPYAAQPITPRQRGYIAALHAELGIEHTSSRDFTKEEASMEIGRLLTIKAERRGQRIATAVREQVPAAQNIRVETASDPVEVGMYRKADGTIYKVQRSQSSGNLYAKKLTPIGGERLSENGAAVQWHFVYDPGAIRTLRASNLLTLDEAKAFGIRYGVCCVCSTTLSDATSVANGIGPVCARRLGRARQTVSAATASERDRVLGPVLASFANCAAAVEPQLELIDNQEEHEIERALKLSVEMSGEGRGMPAIRARR